MSNLPQQDTIVQYVADGVSTTYAVPFYTPIEIDGTPDIDVYVQAATAPPIPAVDIVEWNIDYTYTPNAIDPISGGILTFLPGKIPANGFIVTIVRDVSASLDTEFSQAQNFSGITLDDALDKLLLIAQQNKSYALERNLSYIVNAYIPDVELQGNVQIPVLQANEIWLGAVGGVIAAVLEEPVTASTLRSELANNSPATDGARLVGYYDSVNVAPTTVDAQLTYLTSAVVAAQPVGSSLVHYGSAAPAGYLVCDGAAISRVTYSDLFAVIGSIWGHGNGTTTFNLPNTQHAVMMGSGGTSENPIIGTEVGNTGGEDAHMQDASELSTHNHTAAATTSVSTPSANTASGGLTRIITGSGGSLSSFAIPAAGISTTVVIANTPTVDQTAFNVIQKSVVVLMCIKF